MEVREIEANGDGLKKKKNTIKSANGKETGAESVPQSPG